MDERETVSPADVAYEFFEKFGDGARLQAALCAHQAVVEEDVEACAFWRDVLARLDHLGTANGAPRRREH